MKQLIIVLLALGLFHFLFAEDILPLKTIGGDKFFCYTEKNNIINLQRDKNSATLKIVSTGEMPRLIQDIQFMAVLLEGLSEGNYRVEAVLLADKALKGTAQVRLNEAPYTKLGEISYKLTPGQPFTISVPFCVTEENNGKRLNTPVLMMGKDPVGSSATLSNVRIISLKGK